MSDVITNKTKIIYKFENENIRLNRWDLTLHNTWASAIFAMAELLLPKVRKAISVMFGAAK
jgi:hypothetical protein